MAATEEGIRRGALSTVLRGLKLRDSEDTTLKKCLQWVGELGERRLDQQGLGDLDAVDWALVADQVRAKTREVSAREKRYAGLDFGSVA